jgi:hypothetical protein
METRPAFSNVLLGTPLNFHQWNLRVLFTVVNKENKALDAHGLRALDQSYLPIPVYLRFHSHRHIRHQRANLQSSTTQGTYRHKVPHRNRCANTGIDQHGIPNVALHTKNSNILLKVEKGVQAKEQSLFGWVLQAALWPNRSPYEFQQARLETNKSP